MASRSQCRPGPRPHPVRPHEWSRGIPPQSQRPHLRVGGADDGGRSRINGRPYLGLPASQSNRRTQVGSIKGRPGCRLPFSLLRLSQVLRRRNSSPGARVMTSLETGRQQAAQQEAAGVASIPALATKRLKLRAPGAADATAIASLINDRRIAENTARIPHPYSVADAHAFLGQVNRDPAEPSFAIMRADGTLIGGCGIHVLSGGEPELGYWIGVPHWGRGYATEAARAVLDHAFGTLGYARLTSRARVSNPASRRVL